jgi:hypothetical protein
MTRDNRRRARQRGRVTARGAPRDDAEHIARSCRRFRDGARARSTTCAETSRMVGVGASNPNQSARRRAKYKSQLQMSTGHAVGLGNERLGAR